jgi:hypothetical protein
VFETVPASDETGAAKNPVDYRASTPEFQTFFQNFRLQRTQVRAHSAWHGALAGAPLGCVVPIQGCRRGGIAPRGRNQARRRTGDGGHEAVFKLAAQLLKARRKLLEARLSKKAEPGNAGGIESNQSNNACLS